MSRRFFPGDLGSLAGANHLCSGRTGWRWMGSARGQYQLVPKYCPHGGGPSQMEFEMRDRGEGGPNIDPCGNPLLGGSLPMPSVPALVGSPPVGTSGTGLRPPLWAPLQLTATGSHPPHMTFRAWALGPSTLSSTEGSLKRRTNLM